MTDDCGIRHMKKTNNKYRNNNNNNNQIYSLNYKFDSCSIAGKVCGTALDLIKRYNELAKEAHGNNNYVEMEVFRQYAEHYRKIVTEINEKKNQLQSQNPNQNQNHNQNQNQRNPNRRDNEEVAHNSISAEVANTVSNDNSGNTTASEAAPEAVENAPVSVAEEKTAKKAFKIIEISATDADTVEKVEITQPKKRVYRKKAAVAAV